jgi:hypothetical protein
MHTVPSAYTLGCQISDVKRRWGGATAAARADADADAERAPLLLALLLPAPSLYDTCTHTGVSDTSTQPTRPHARDSISPHHARAPREKGATRKGDLLIVLLLFDPRLLVLSPTVVARPLLCLRASGVLSL